MRSGIWLTAAALATWMVAAPAIAQNTRATPSAGQAATASEAGAFVATLADSAVAKVTDKALAAEERKTRFRALFLDGFDVPAIARFVLGRYWRLATDAERGEYLKLFEDAIVETYAHRFADYSGEQLRVLSTRAADGEAFVFSEMIRPTGAPVKVDWRLRREGTSFKITDIVIEGVSMGVTQRDDFSAVIQRSGGKIEGLLASLREKAGAR